MKLENKDKVVLRILKDVSREYNANSLSKVLKLSAMGVLKILRNLEGEGIVISNKVSNIKFYGFNFDSSYSKDYASLILKKEAESSSAYVKRWVEEIRKVGIAKVSMLFGSVLSKGKSSNDIDVLFIVDKRDFGKLKNEIAEMNKLTDKKIHPVYQTEEDFVNNLKNKDKVILEIVKGILVFGEREFVNILENVK
ncbi:MAG: hypothetical protein ACOC1P_00820 [Minisyncoccales bacterium]